MQEENPHIIIDNGTGYIKAGFSVEERPSAVFPSVVGRPKNATAILGLDYKDFYVGSNADERRGVLKLDYPIEHGVIEDWDGMEKIWEHCFTFELRCEASEHNVILTEAPMNPKENREKMASIMFDTFNVPALYIAIQAVLSLFSAGKTTGIVCDSGDGVSHFVPIFDGYSLPHSIIRLDLAGRDITRYFQRLLTEIGLRFTTSSEFEITRILKEKVCYVALDPEEEMKIYRPKNYELPDGRVITVKDQMFRAPECLFKPENMGKEGKGFAESCFDSIQKSDIDIRKDLYENILLSGGTSMMRGLPERFEREIKSLVPKKMISEVRVIAPPERKYAVWEGGSILSSSPTFETMWITKEEYDEEGASIVHRKCF